MNFEVNEFDALCNFVYKTYSLTKQAPFKTRWKGQLISTPNVNLRILTTSISIWNHSAYKTSMYPGWLLL